MADRTMYCHKCDKPRSHAKLDYADGGPEWLVIFEPFLEATNPGDIAAKRLWMCGKCAHLRTRVLHCPGRDWGGRCLRAGGR